MYHILNNPLLLQDLLTLQANIPSMEHCLCFLIADVHARGRAEDELTAIGIFGLESAITEPQYKHSDRVAVKTDVQGFTILAALLHLDCLQQLAEDVGFDHKLLWN